MSQPEMSEERRGGTGLPGCVILCAILVVFGGLIALYTVIGMKQNGAIDEFTVDDPADIEVLVPTEEEKKAAEDKLFAVKAAVTQNKAELIPFTKKDINVLIATLDATEDFRGRAFVSEITDQGMVVEMAQPLRKGIFSRGHRYLNADFTFEPEVRKRTIAFKVKDIRSHTGAVPEKFIGMYSSLDFFRLDPDNEELMAVIGSLKRVFVEDGQVFVQTQMVTEE